MTPEPRTPLPPMAGPKYQPQVDDVITVEIPDERTRAVIRQVVSPTTCLAEITQYTTSRSHNFKKGEIVPCRFEPLGFGVPGWRAVSQRELDAATVAVEKKPEPVAEAPKPRPKRSAPKKTVAKARAKVPVKTKGKSRAAGKR